MEDVEKLFFAENEKNVVNEKIQEIVLNGIEVNYL